MLGNDFMDTLRADDGIEEWQANQAKNALLIYYEQFRGIRLADDPHETRTPSSMTAADVHQFLSYDVKTTMIYTHLLYKGPLGVVSPLDTL